MEDRCGRQFRVAGATEDIQPPWLMGLERDAAELWVPTRQPPPALRTIQVHIHIVANGTTQNRDPRLSSTDPKVDVPLPRGQGAREPTSPLATSAGCRNVLEQTAACPVASADLPTSNNYRARVLANSPDQLVAFWTAVSAVATVAIAVAAVFFGLAENAKRIEVEERTKRERRTDSRDRALERASTVRVRDLGNGMLRIANTGNHTFTDVALTRYQPDERGFGTPETTDLGIFGPDHALATAGAHYWRLRYIDQDSRVFENDGIGPNIIYDPGDDVDLAT